jgi:hypothetical protein
LYVLVAETIANAIRKDSSIDGYLLPDGSRTKVFQYADDTSILVQSDNSIRALFSLFDRYERASGAKLNVTKSHGLLLGLWKHRSDLPVPLNCGSPYRCRDFVWVLYYLSCSFGIYRFVGRPASSHLVGPQ